MRLKEHAGSVYLDPSRRQLVKRNRRAHPFAFGLSLLLAMAFLFTSVNFAAVPPPSTAGVAFADEDEDPEKGFEEAVEGEDSSQEGFDNILKEWDEKGSDAIEDQTKSLSYAIFRQFTIKYINEAPKAVIPGDADDPRTGPYNCNPNAEGVGTLMYHNCDVPNLLTEFLQDGVDLLMPAGAVGAEQEAAYMGSSRWGLSSHTPRKVDVNTGIKYTALEKYGYNLKFTSYAGEWDHIKVMTAARALSNFGLMDNLKLGVAAIINGLTAGLDVALEGLVDDLTSGNIVRIATAPFHAIVGFFKGATAASINTIMDTSETNIFTTHAWYRPGFSSTMYGARELSEAEIAAIMQQHLLDVITASLPDGAKPPTDLTNMENPPRPQAAKCVVTLKNTNSDATYTKTHPDPTSITSQALCRTWGTQFVTETVKLDEVVFTPPETLAAWQGRTWGPVASAYGISCSVDSTGNYEAELTKFYSCWNSAWADAMESELKNAQASLNVSWWEETIMADNIRKGLAGAKNFNDPRSRYICTDKETGKDLGGDEYVYLFKSNGRLNGECQLPVRAPIQDGFFGNGYRAEQGTPTVDPRRSQFQPELLDLLGYNTMSSSVAGFGLTVSTVTTRVSNTVLNLSMSPILESLGVDVIVAEMVKGFRDSIFYPLAVLMVALGAITIFFNSLKERNYTRQIANAGLLCLTFIIGVIFLERPMQIIHAVDAAPAAVEAVVVGSIFEVGNSDHDNLCKATSDPSAGGKGFNGEQLSFDPSASSRVLICENWRTFAFTPYVFGQWGTSYSSLDNSAMENSNDALVGDAEVNLGNASMVERNWALYQVDSYLTGTSTLQDPSQPSGAVSPDFYKIVDLQAHPDVNNVGTPDSRYFDMWAGNQGGARAFVALLGAALSVLGLITVVIYSFAKIQVSLLVTLMLLFMPFMFLIGLHPTQGRQKLKGYFAQIGAMMIQRVLLVTMIAMMMRILVAMSTVTESFFLFFILAFATCAAFLSYRKEIIGLFSRGLTDKFGGFASKELEDPRAAMAEQRILPKSMSNYVALKKSTWGGMASGAVGGYIVGGSEGAKFAAQQIGGTAARRQERALARGGSGAMFSAYQGGQQAKEDIRKDLSKRAKPLREELRGELLKTNADPATDPEAAQAEDSVRRRLLGEMGSPTKRKEFKEISAAIEAHEDRDAAIRRGDKRSDRDVRRQVSQTPRLQDREEAIQSMSDQARELRDHRADVFANTEREVEETSRPIVERFNSTVEEEVLRLQKEQEKATRTKAAMRQSSEELTDRLLGSSREDNEGS